jgi:phosphate transport system substrate-binding protein
MVHLVSAWAEVYMREHPRTEISVTGGGSGTGFAALLNGTTDLCAASREMMLGERDVAASKGLQPVSQLVARDGVAVVVHPSNPVDALSIEQIRHIFTGAVSNWKQVGGADREIVAYSRDSSSGTFVFFQEHVLLKSDFRPDARLMPATSAIVQSVAEDEGAVGYVGLGYATGAGERVKTVAVSRVTGEAPVAPSSDSIREGQYAIARPLRVYTLGPPAGLAASFLDFCLGPDGQEIVRRTGYVTVQ